MSRYSMEWMQLEPIISETFDNCGHFSRLPTPKIQRTNLELIFYVFPFSTKKYMFLNNCGTILSVQCILFSIYMVFLQINSKNSSHSHEARSSKFLCCCRYLEMINGHFSVPHSFLLISCSFCGLKLGTVLKVPISVYLFELSHRRAEA